MAVEARTSVSAIEGIGPATAAALAQIGVYTVFDLMRGSLRRLYAVVRSLASTEEVRSWKRMAALLQVAELTPQWCEALVRNGIETIDELLERTVDEVDAIMRQAIDQGVIPNAPTTTQMAEMLKDAAVIKYTGSITGTLLDMDRQPVMGATMRVGPASAESDERGRFRVLRIPLGAPIPLRVDHPDYQSLVMESPKIARDVEVVSVQVFRLVKRAVPTEPPTSVGSVRLSELDGDALPVPRGVPVRQVMVQVNELQPGDILMARQFYSSAPDVQLVSRLKSYQDGEIVVRIVRVPVDRLPGEVALRDHFRFSDSEFVRIEMTSADLHRYKIRLRMRKALAERPQPATPEEKQAYVEEQIAFLVDHGYFAVRRRTQA